MTLGLAVALGRGGAIAAEPERVVVLPPFIVDDTTPRRPWRTVSVPGVEVLSSCEDHVTRELVQTFQRAHALVDLILPRDFRVRFDAPQLLILYDDELWPLAAREALADSLQSGLGDPGSSAQRSMPLSARRTGLQPTVGLTNARGAAARSGERVEFMRNMTLFDLDLAATFVLVAPRDAHVSSPYLTPEYLEELIARRTPALPAWFARGFFRLYRNVSFATSELKAAPFVWPEPSALGAAQTEGRPLLPVRELFADRPSDADGRSSEQQVTWLAQLELFVRWGLDPRGGPRREGFWKFVARCAAEPVSEQLFRDCFGIDFAQAGQELAAFLPVAAKNAVTWRDEGERSRALDLRDATPGEVARIKGEWERLEIGFVQKELPDLETKYAAQARRTLRRAYENGERDPRLLASLGLFEWEAGLPNEGRVRLQEAADAGVVRPRVYLRLAARHLSEQRTRSTRTDLKISREQAEPVLALLAEARRKAPALYETYRVAVQVWESCAVAPDDEGTRVLAEGLALFPRRAELAYRTAALWVTHGRRDAAIACVRRALELDATDGYRPQLEKLARELGIALAE